MFVVYDLSQEAKTEILRKFSPAYDKVVLDHITAQFGVPDDVPPPPTPKKVEVCGYFNSGDGVEGLLVSVDGSTARPDGGKYHITLSLGAGADGEKRKSSDANRYTETATILEKPFVINVEPKSYRSPPAPVKEPKMNSDKPQVIKSPPVSVVASAEAAIAAAGFSWQPTSGPELVRHLARHAPGSLTIGSKFSDEVWARFEEISSCMEARAKIALASRIEKAEPLRVEITMPFKNAGTEGVVSLDDAVNSIKTCRRLNVTRDAGTPHEQTIDVAVLASGEQSMAADRIVYVAGAYGDTKKIGLYTMFPGDPGCPFPTESLAKRDPDAYKISEKYWASHVFVGTAEEVQATLKDNLAALPPGEDMPARVNIRREMKEMECLSSKPASSVARPKSNQRMQSPAS